MKTKNKKGIGVYSSFIYVDVEPNPKKKEDNKKLCKIKEFEKWVLENKSIQLCPMNYMRINPKITEFIKEYALKKYQLKVYGWSIPFNFVMENEIKITTENEEKIIKIK